MHPLTVRRLALVALVFQALIVVSGAAVRLTEAGLGCEDWPRCTEDRLVPEWELHGWIEFGNRLISLVVSLSTIAVLVAAYRRAPRRQDLVDLAWLLVAGTLAQIVLGGITVLLDLNPVAVSGHFLVSMALLYVAFKLWRRADPAGPARARPVADETTRWLLRAQLPLASIVLVTGTIVTGSGPNSGDSRADRLGFELTAVARIHSVTVWLLLACLVGLAATLVRRPTEADPGADRRTETAPIVRLLLLLAVAQGAVGYTQFASGVPPALVEVHVAGAVAVWLASVALHQRAFDQGPDTTAPDASPDSGRHDRVPETAAS